jgi:hypothetical protein
MDAHLALRDSKYVEEREIAAWDSQSVINIIRMIE